ncbi:hypothetical protein LJR030_005566 [Rhizobium sp. LjRoot30]|uniref:hypothetical protein n=1 Tax=Rhizobium sp. LjRoot30 TaxID=3342320 RepID=UPI003ECC7BFE
MTTISPAIHAESQVRKQLRPVVIAVVTAKLLAAAILVTSVNLAPPAVADMQVAALSKN